MTFNISYVTGNSGKFKEAQKILSDWTLKQEVLTIDEIQGTAMQIILHKAETALKLCKEPIIIEDVSVYCEALCGMPGPYVKDFLIAMKEKGLAELVHKYSNHTAEVVCLAAYAKEGQKIQIFEGRVKGRIVHPKGDLRYTKHSWNTIFIPDGENKTMGELSIEEHAQRSMRMIALTKLKKHLGRTMCHECP
jgi:inosine triphosphate pyrophosphatase